MRVGVFSDIHSNWQALTAVVEHARDVDEILCLGDVVGYGGDPLRCVDLARDSGWLTLVGNHDRACTDDAILDWFNPDAATAIRWTREQLGEDRLGWLAERPERESREGVMLVHASPRDPIYEYILDGTTAAANLAVIEDKACFHGHSHIPGMFYLDQGQVAHNYWHGRAHLKGPMLLNPGSVGQPRDGDPLASYAVWDTEAATFEWRRLAYDVEGAQAAIRSAGLPDRFAERLAVGR